MLYTPKEKLDAEWLHGFRLGFGCGALTLVATLAAVAWWIRTWQ